MTIRLGTNIYSLQAQRRLGEAAEKTSDVFRRLSSGQRITRASDDSAGLAIADSLSLRNRVFGRGVQNLNDGIGLLTQADSAVEELTRIATRIYELAQQGASGTYSAAQRGALDKEAQLLRDEFARVARSTSFNGLRLFDGSVQGLGIQAGFGTSGAVVSSLGGDIGTGILSDTGLYGAGAFSIAGAIADLNGDGNQDIVTTGTSGNILVLRGNGNGTFGAATSFSVGAAPTAITLADFNGDGVMDVVTSNSASNTVALLRGNGDGTFGAASSFTVGASPSTIAVADFNGDGTMDVVTGNFSSGNVSILRGNGNGSFAAATNYTVGTGPESIGLGDFDGDGIVDVVTANSGSSNISVLRGNGNGTFAGASNIAVSGGPFSVAIGDFNADGRLDIGVARNPGSVRLLLGNGNATFAAAGDLVLPGGVTSIAVADLDGDGRSDIVASSEPNASLAAYRVNGDGSFSLQYSAENLHA